MYIVPNSTKVQEFAQHMQDFWNRTHLIDNERNIFAYEPLNFIFLDSEEELERIYYEEDPEMPVIQLAVVFDSDNPFENMSVLKQILPHSISHLLYREGLTQSGITRMQSFYPLLVASTPRETRAGMTEHLPNVILTHSRLYTL